MQVTGEAQGSEDNIKSLLKELNKGPSAAHVVKVEKQEIDTKVCTFQIDVFPTVVVAAKLELLDIVWKGKWFYSSSVFFRIQVHELKKQR